MQKLRKQLIEEKVKNAPEKVKNLYLRNFDRMNFRDDQDFDEYVNEIDAALSDLNQKPARDNMSNSKLTAEEMEYAKKFFDDFNRKHNC